jgi:uncharacterized surface protein with fasciclin (FAS1) repeats
MKLLKLAPLALALVLTGATTASIAQVTVGGAPMVATKDTSSRSRRAAAKAMLTTAAGGKLTAMASGNTITVADESGGTANVTIADVLQSNGVIHVVDKVLLPK